MTTMNPFDLVVLIIIVLSTFWGGLHGIISQVGTLAAWGVSLIVSARYYGIFEPMTPVPEQWKTTCATFVAFVISFIAISIATRFVKRAVSLAGFKEFDRQIGALIGLLKGVVLCMAITFFCVLVNEKTREVVDSSKSGAFFIGVIANVQDAFPDSELKTKFAEVAATLKHADEHKSVSDEVDSLKQYLTTHVFTQTAAEVVKEADEVKEAQEKGKSASNETTLFQRFVDSMHGLEQKVQAQVVKTTPNASLNDTSVASNATNGYATSSRSGYDESNYSSSNAGATSANSNANSENDASGFQQFWNSLGVSSSTPVAASTTQTQAQNVQNSISGATFDDYAQEPAAENNASSDPPVEYGAYRTKSSSSSSRLRSFRYSTVGPSNY